MGIEFTMGAAGLATLTWNGADILFEGGNAPAVIEMYGRAGDRSGASWMGNAPLAVTASGDTVMQTFDWGTVTTRYQTAADCEHDNRLYVTVVIENTSDVTLYRYWLYPLALDFGAVVSDPDNPHGFSVDAPCVVLENWETGAVALAYDDVRRQVALGFWQAESPAAGKWFVSLYVDPGQNRNENWPTIVRPVAPGASESISFSLRFGPPNVSVEALAGDVFARYRGVYPRILTPPPAPARPIARLSFNGRFNPGFPTNPRGWFNSPDVDVTTREGIRSFQDGLLASADSSVEEMTRMGAYGGVIWDIEGQQLDQSYIGDPSQAEILAPELIGVLDEFVRRFQSAGFAIGFTLRPQRFSVDIGRIDVSGTQVAWRAGAQFSPFWAGDRTGGALAFGVGNYYIASVESPRALTLDTNAGEATGIPYFYARQFNTSHFEEMRRKIQYCRERWGATLFYVDSTLFYSGNTTPAESFAKLWELYPDTYLFPEWKNPRHYAYTYPWTDTINGYILPDPHTLMTYPDAAGLVRVPGDGEIDAVEADLTEAVRTGSILLFDGWYQHHANDVVMRIYKNAQKK